ncbi:hypothetical protein CR105_27430 [Massilia eurypsychrophila]|uniref:Uncharacterized protein n=1 Tax=Massilia eurypsychrophila TaxID=1485217 RepID=A0A2G8T7B1_9BURK|nr:hypothetical protein CR105_27430 [Massilia eurypsychrophila]
MRGNADVLPGLSSSIRPFAYHSPTRHRSVGDVGAPALTYCDRAEATANAITGLFARAADLAKLDDKLDAEGDLREASAHWLRHEMLTALVNHTGDLKIGQDHAGHENIA